MWCCCTLSMASSYPRYSSSCGPCMAAPARQSRVQGGCVGPPFTFGLSQGDGPHKLREASKCHPSRPQAGAPKTAAADQRTVTVLYVGHLQDLGRTAAALGDVGMQCHRGLSAATMQHSWHTHAVVHQHLHNACPGIVPMQPKKQPGQLCGHHTLSAGNVAEPSVPHTADWWKQLLLRPTWPSASLASAMFRVLTPGCASQRSSACNRRGSCRSSGARSSSCCAAGKDTWGSWASFSWPDASGCLRLNVCCSCISGLMVSRPPMQSGMAAHALHVSLC